MRTPTTTSHPRRARAWRVRLAAAAGALALLFSGMVGATAAMADTRTDPTPPPSPTTGSLTIHKLEGAETGDVNNGTEITGIKGIPLNGVEFTVTQVTGVSDSADKFSFDLTSSEGWENMRKAGVQNDVENIAAGVTSSTTRYTYGKSEFITTGAVGTDGIALFEDLPLGLYIVMETGNTNNVFSSTDPFLVTIPLNIQGSDGNPTGELLYDVHVYPKNNIAANPVKTVKPEGNFSEDGVLTWTVSQKVPTLLKTDSIDSFVIVDTLDSRLAFQESSVVVTMIGVGEPAVDETLTVVDDYEVNFNDTDNIMTINFTAAGIAKLVAKAQGKTVNVSFKSTASAIGEYTNNAYTNINDAKYDADPKTATWGGLRILKYDGEATKDETSSMAGAEFAIYDGDPIQNPGTAKIVATGVTGSDGTLEIKYLWIGEDGAESHIYWIVETKAPAGYVLNENPRRVEVKVDENTVGYFTEVEVLNYKTFIPGLPLTGAQGTAIIIAVGITFLVAAAGLLILRNRRSHSA